MELETALITIVRNNRDGVEAGELRRALEAKGYKAADVREAIRGLLDRGALRLGQDLRFEEAQAA